MDENGTSGKNSSESKALDGEYAVDEPEQDENDEELSKMFGIRTQRHGRYPQRANRWHSR